jgi:hypothetical protein
VFLVAGFVFFNISVPDFPRRGWQDEAFWQRVNKWREARRRDLPNRHEDGTKPRYWL